MRRFLGIRPLVWAIVAVLAWASYAVWHDVLTHDADRHSIQTTVPGRA